MTFKDSIRRTKHLTEAYDLNILVSGAGRGSPEHFEKRQKVKQQLRDCFRNAEVLFSEELDLSSVLDGAEGLTLANQELWHLAACDICIVLDTSKGAGEEIAHFVDSDLAHKLFILTHERYKNSSSFPAALRERENQYFYNDAEYESCSVVEKVLMRVRTIALDKLYGMRA